MKKLEEISLTNQNLGLTVADAVWVATALLHQRHGLRLDAGFTTEDIVNEVQRGELTKGQYKSIYQHVNQHCVANREPQPNRTRMLFALGGGCRRIYLPGDKYCDGREGSPTKPTLLPKELTYLSSMYDSWVLELRPKAAEELALNPFADLAGTWVFGPADEYVNQLREGWE